MQNTYNDSRVIYATDYPNLSDTLRNAFNNLENVQKGLNTYLETKRLYFARFFFLTNDEILEILSETKDPKRVQPYLRKCFEGVGAIHYTHIVSIYEFINKYFFSFFKFFFLQINSLEFDSNDEIIALISSENEKLQLNKKINPTASNVCTNMLSCTATDYYYYSIINNK